MKVLTTLVLLLLASSVMMDDACSMVAAFCEGLGASSADVTAISTGYTTLATCSTLTGKIEQTKVFDSDDTYTDAQKASSIETLLDALYTDLNSFTSDTGDFEVWLNTAKEFTATQLEENLDYAMNNKKTEMNTILSVMDTNTVDDTLYKQSGQVYKIMIDGDTSSFGMKSVAFSLVAFIPMLFLF